MCGTGTFVALLALDVLGDPCLGVVYGQVRAVSLPLAEGGEGLDSSSSVVGVRLAGTGVVRD